MVVWCCRPCCSVNLLLLTLPLLLSVCQGSDVIMYPNVTNLKINEGDPLEFTCEHKGFGDIRLSYPRIEDDCDSSHISDLQQRETSVCEVQVSSSSLFEGEKITFRRAKSVLGDTGIYGCVFNLNLHVCSRRINVTVIPKNKDQDNDDADDDYVGEYFKPGHQDIIPYRQVIHMFVCAKEDTDNVDIDSSHIIEITEKDPDNDDVDYSDMFEMSGSSTTDYQTKEDTDSIDIDSSHIFEMTEEEPHNDDVNYSDSNYKDSDTFEMSGSSTTDYQNTKDFDFDCDLKQTFLLNEMNESIIKAESTIDLLCNANGVPIQVKISFKNDELLKIDEQRFFLNFLKQTLTIKYLTKKDKYSCIAKHFLGQIMGNFHVPDDKGTEVSKSWIIGIVGVVLVIILVPLIIFFFVKDKRKKKKDLIKMSRQRSIEMDLKYFEEGDVDCINPELPADDQAELLPYDRKWEFPREKLKLGKQLGSGAFGVVMKAEARGIHANEHVTTVAVKMVRRNVESAYIRALVIELKIMVHLGKHLNVVNLLGACTNNIAKNELLVIVEFCRFGNLHNYLLRHRGNFVNQIDLNTGKIDPSIDKERRLRPNSVDSRSSDDSQPGWRSNYQGDDNDSKSIRTQDLLSWAFQVARGMEYLCQRKVLHGDLAARNILLAENNVVKICDFGLAKNLYKGDNYQKTGNLPLPIKWMAIESIRDRVFSTQSDVWSFGIVLWEFFTLAKTPYPGMQVEKLYQSLIEGYRMEKPPYATDEIYDIIVQCWSAEPTLRPSFSYLVKSIGSLLEEGVKTHYVELNVPYMNFNASLECKCDYLKMMSAPDHATLTTSQRDDANSPRMTILPNLSHNSRNSLDESRILSPRVNSTEDLRFRTPSSSSITYANSTHADSDETPMLINRLTPEQEQDLYLTPNDVTKKREEFVRQLRDAEKRERREHCNNDLDSSRYYNTKGLLDVRLEVVPELVDYLPMQKSNKVVQGKKS